MSSGMDLSNFDTTKKSTEGVLMQIESPSGDKLWEKINDETKEPVGLFLLGADSPQFVTASRKRMDERLSKGMAKLATMKLSSTLLDDEALDILVACTKGWQHIVVDKQTWAFSPENCRTLYTRFPFIREQASAFIDDRRNFLGN